MKHRVTIQSNPANPVNYLACCGAFDLLARMDAAALGSWVTTAPVTFCLESTVSERDLLATVVGTLCSPGRWAFLPPDGEPARIEARFTAPDGRDFHVPLDWWLETAELDGTIRDKSAWKMYAGQQTIRGIVSDMIAEAANLRPAIHSNASIAGLLDHSVAMTGRFGFDPRASRNALDVGYSPNDLQMPVRTFVFAEMLACFGLQSFFPGRTGRPSNIASTRGWRGADDGEGEKGFVYCVWAQPLPVGLARLAAARPEPPPFRILFAPRARRKNYSNLTLARTIEPKITK